MLLLGPGWVNRASAVPKGDPEDRFGAGALRKREGRRAERGSRHGQPTAGPRSSSGGEGPRAAELVPAGVQGSDGHVGRAYGERDHGLEPGPGSRA